MRRTLSILAAVVATLALAAPVGAITNGSPDAGEHPFVGELLFYVPDAHDPRFTDSGEWFTCSGTLMTSTIVVTAGHCTFAIGLNGASTTHGGEDTTAAEGGVGGNDVWISFSEAPNFTILPPSSTFTTQADRYAAWSSALNASSEWHRGTATSHPLFDDVAPVLHDAGVVRLSSGVTMGAYGQLARTRWLDRYRGPAKRHSFEAVGYGLERVQGKKEFGGDTRRKSEPKLNNLNGKPVNTYMILSNNTATGGTCFGDSGGPIFDTTSSRLVVGVTSFGANLNCAGIGGVYRLDQPDDQAFLATFGIQP